jgi:hypothetical protein
MKLPENVSLPTGLYVGCPVSRLNSEHAHVYDFAGREVARFCDRRAAEGYVRAVAIAHCAEKIADRLFEILKNAALASAQAECTYKALNRSLPYMEAEEDAESAMGWANAAVDRGEELIAAAADAFAGVGVTLAFDRSKWEHYGNPPKAAPEVAR